MLSPLFQGLILAAAVFSGCTNHVQPYVRMPEARRCFEKSVSELRGRLLLIGDSGRPSINAKRPVLEKLSRWASQEPSKTTVLFLGDNIYDGVLNAKRPVVRRRAEERLRVQLQAIAESGARAVFIPGNHDWDGGRGGLCRQAELIEQFERGASRIQFVPQPCGCPGPQELEFDAFRLAVIDTNWLRDNEKDPKQSAHCSAGTEEAVLAQLAALLPGKKPLVLAGHHGLVTYGSHGQFYNTFDHLFPLRQGGWTDYLWLPMPGIGSLFPLLHGTLGCALDACGPIDRRVQRPLRKLLSKDPPLLYAGAHDHSLQVLEGAPMAELILISGGGSPALINEVTHGSETLFAQSASGFMAIDFLKDGWAVVRVITGAAGASAEAYRGCLRWDAARR